MWWNFPSGFPFAIHTKMADLAEQRTKRKIRDARRTASRIYIGDSISKWRLMRDKEGIDNEEFAAALLDE